MRPSLAMPSLALLVLLGLVALGAVALAGERTRAAEDSEAILLDRKNTCTGSFGASADPPPTSIYLGYGAFKSRPIEPIAVVFDEQPINPSPLDQVFKVYVADDPDAAALAAILSTAPPPESVFGVGTWFPKDDGIGVGSCGHALLRVPDGSRIEYFKLTLMPLSIEKVTEPAPLGGIISFYRAGPITPIIEAWGTPPPGDANCTASIDSLDALVMLQYGAGLLNTLSCAKAADVNADGTVDARDVQLVLQFTAGLIEEL